jgi:catecholate siderophore receptor
MNNHLLRSSLAVLLAAGTFARLSAQVAAPAPASSEEVLELERFKVTGVPVEEQILPTSRPFSSVFGLDRNIVDTPRNVTIISREQLDAISIQDVRDFSKLTASSFTTTNFGAPANPTIRGQYADLLINGIRRVATSNGNGLPLNFNSVESVNIVKGPATVVHGATFYVGGYADLVTKRPSFDTAKGSVTATFGMYDQRRWTLDYGAPISKTSAYRISYSGEESGSYYDDGKKDTQALYAAYTYRPGDNYELFINSEFFYGNYTENFGINRVTQALIDNGTYVTGVNNNPAPPYVNGAGLPINFGNLGVPAGAPAPVSDAQNSRWVVSGFPATNRVVPTGTVQADRRSRLLRPGDDSNGRMLNLQVLQTFEPDADTKIVSNTYLLYIKRDTISSYHYSEIVDPAWSIESRLEYQKKFGKHQINAGLSGRYQATKAYNHFFFEPASVWDLTKDHNFINAYNSVNWPDQFPVPGWPGRFATPGTFDGDTNDSSILQLAPFFQSVWNLGDKVILDVGARSDYTSIESTDPLGPLISAFSSVASLDESLWLPNYNGSLSYKFTPKLTGYVTYNYSKNYGGAVANGGGIKPTSTPGELSQPSTLLEVGAKQSLLDNKLFIGISAFQQDRVVPQLDGSTRQFDYSGFELELNYQPNKSFYATFAYSYLEALSDRPQFDVGNVVFYDGSGSLADPSNYAIHPDNLRFFMVDRGFGEYRIQGLPRNLFNFLVSYKFENGFGLSVNGLYHTDINNNVAGSLVIPSQYSLDVTASYTVNQWTTKLAVLNATNEDNWAPPNSVYGNESILAELPIRAELTVAYKF